MYFKYIWNNFLHIQVEICTAMILAMPPAPTEIQPDTEQEHARESILIKHVRSEETKAFLMEYQKVFKFQFNCFMNMFVKK